MTNEELAHKYIPEAIKALKVGWTKEVIARNKNGNSCKAEDPDACRWCLVGALRASGTTLEEFEFIRVYIQDKTDGLGKAQDLFLSHLSVFNDAQDSVDSVIQLLEYVISDEV